MSKGTRTLTLAAVQMDANPAPTRERLARAETLVAEAAAAGAMLVVLPELFNLGYGYTPENFRRAEPLYGPTAAWMQATAQRLNLHLAGSLLLRDQGEIYNSLLLFSPQGRMWRYDKLYPWGWERGYFRPGKAITIAQTDLGAIGMMVCWDVAHPTLWRRYAGQVDLMVISSCPPDGSNPTCHFPNGRQVTVEQLGPIMKALKGTARRVFGKTVNQQTAWIGVPSVQTVCSGHIKTEIPNGLASVCMLLPVAHWVIRYLPYAAKLQMSCKMVEGCKIVAATGH
ncbi:MAG: carbon-nitrogen hydrolase family protein, partial [Anaerolineae bacterium]|nr:carbon-nitrogen hydrolase family protein [Anaerolineae bacterium]